MRKNQEKKTRPTRTENKANFIQDALLVLFQQNRSKSFTVSQVIKKLGLTSKKQKDALRDVMHELARQNTLTVSDENTFRLNDEPQFITGEVDYVQPRFAFIISPESAKDVRVNSEALAGALDGDTVKVMVYPTGKRLEGEVVEIIQRKRDEFVGKVDVLPKYAFVVPDFKKMHVDVYVRPENLNGAKTNDKVIVKITRWPTDDRKPEGEVIRVLGKAGEHETEMHSIMAEFGLPFDFPEAVKQESQKIPEGITGEEIAKRRDFRRIPTFTIDPEDAKDFDDALSVRSLGDDRWEIGVHIADVTHYVLPKSHLEKEANQRATSVYLVDRTIPMLPERLSNELCSLRPHEDKLTFSAVFDMDAEGHIHNEWFGRTIIHSDRRFSYEQAQQVLESRTGDYADELDLLNTLAKKICAERFRNGAISFETVEVKFKLDKNGVPLSVHPKIRQDAHKLIEEFMLLANRKVAEFVHNQKKGQNKNTMVYRIHDRPDLEKVQTFAKFVRKFGYSLQVEDKNIAGSINHLIDSIEGKPEQNVLQTLAIRTMAKARYSTDNIGHFGLAFPFYTHFTSPIRRYPDMMVHRLLQHYLDDGRSVNKTTYEEQCKHSSDMEKIAADAERASIKYKQVEYMQRLEGDVFDGIVTGVTEFGVFVEIIESRCEGLVRMSDMDDDYYELDAENYRIVGRRTGKMITFGDKVTVRVVDTNLDRRSMDLAFVRMQPSKLTKKDAAQTFPKRPKGRTIKKESEEYGFDF